MANEYNCSSDGSPIWGGTYLPKTSWMSVLKQINDLYKKQYDDVLGIQKVERRINAGWYC